MPNNWRWSDAMKPIHLFLLLLLPALSANAQQSTTALPAWDQLSDAQRAELVAPLRDRWDRFPGERARMLERAQRWQSMPPGKRMQAERGLHRWERMDPARRAQMQALFEKTRDMPPEQRHATFVLFRALLPLDATQRQALLQQWRSMTPVQRGEWLESHRPRHRGHDDD
jgi:hypothetical protein